jgi:hypothetical protein
MMCPKCGVEVSFWRLSPSTLCDACAASQRQERERRKQEDKRSGAARKTPTLVQQIVAILGMLAGIGLAAAITYRYGFQGREDIEQILLLILWVVAPMLGAVIGATLVGLRWLPKGIDPTVVAAGLVAGIITVVACGLLFFTLEQDPVASKQIPGMLRLPTKVRMAIWLLPAALVWGTSYVIVYYIMRRYRG